MSVLRPTHLPLLADRWRGEGWWADETLWQVYERTARARATSLAVVDGGTRLTFEMLLARASTIAGRLVRVGVGPGTPVAFQLPNWWETIAVYLALARLGAVAVPVLPIARERELGFVLAESAARVLLIPGALRGVDHRELALVARRAAPALDHVITVRGAPGPRMRALDDLEDGAPGTPASGAETTALLMYTSGTTAEPKGVLHTHATLVAEAHSLKPVHELSPDDTVLMPSPLTHVSGLAHALLAPATAGVRTVLMPRWNPDDALALIARERISYMVGAPTFLRELADHPKAATTDVGSFRLFSCGGASVDPTLLRTSAERFDCIAKRVYGSTEFPTVSTTHHDDPVAARVETDGRPIGPVEVRIADDGEVQARGPECFVGYSDASQNADAFTDDDWFRTGDLGTLDSDGFLTITGRLKDIIIRKGENISAREIEDLAVTHPSIAEIAVIGLPDTAAGEIACAVLRLRPGAPPPTVDTLAQHLRAAGLSTRKLPERVEIVRDFPRTDSGKVLKRGLRERFTS